MVMWVWLYQNLCLQNFDIDIYRYCGLSIKISVDSIYRPSLTIILHTTMLQLATCPPKWPTGSKIYV